jgi:hypothetical protein
MKGRAITIHLPYEMIKALQGILSKGLYEDRSELIRDGIRRVLVEFGVQPEPSIAIGSRMVDARKGGLVCPNCESFLIKKKVFKCKLCNRTFNLSNRGLEPLI